MKPQGRLTLQPGKPVMDLPDITSGSVWYTPYEGNTIPLWDGLRFVDTSFSEMSLPLSGTGLFDVLYDGILSLVLWGVRPSLTQGVWTLNNKTYLGSVYVVNGQAKFQLLPTAVPYGTNNILGLWNAYNRVRVTALCRDLTESWSYGSSGERFANNSDRWRISWIDGLGQSYVKASYQTSVAGMSNGNAAATVDCVCDANYPLQLHGQLNQAALNNNFIGMMLEGRGLCLPKLGLHYFQAVEQSTSVPIMFYGNDFSALTVELEM